MLAYLFNVSLCLSAFFLVYVCLLRNTTFFHLNRLYLLFGIIASLVIPAITIPRPYEQLRSASLETVWLDATHLVAGAQPVTSLTTDFKYTQLISIAYAAGVLFLLGRLCFQLRRHVQEINQHPIRFVEGLRVIRSGRPGALTFFNVIVLPDYEVNPSVLSHEKAHVLQRHWIDLLAVEFMCILLWFNPIVLLYRNAIKQQHEYLADASAVDSGISVDDYLQCLLTGIERENNVVLANTFSSKPIKQRIKMITKQKTSRKFKSVYLSLMPLLSVLVLAFSTDRAIGPQIAINHFQPVKENIAFKNSDEPSISPVQMESAIISSEYGWRIHPVLGGNRFHTGIDFQLEEGRDVMSTAAGTVSESRYDSLRGNLIIIKHSSVYATSYSHLKAAFVKTGDHVILGQKIGTVGSTGAVSAGPHLHYEVLKDGKPVDPKNYLPKQ